MNKHNTRHRGPGEEIDVKRVVKYLNYRFKEITEPLNDNSSGTPLHGYQKDFSYILNQIDNAPQRVVGKVISQANSFLDSIKV